VLIAGRRTALKPLTVRPPETAFRQYPTSEFPLGSHDTRLPVRMGDSRYRHRMTAPEAVVGIDIAAPPERVWVVITDITVMPKFSTELQGVEWADGFSTAHRGAQFLGQLFHPLLEFLVLVGQGDFGAFACHGLSDTKSNGAVAGDTDD